MFLRRGINLRLKSTFLSLAAAAAIAVVPASATSVSGSVDIAGNTVTVTEVSATFVTGSTGSGDPASNGTGDFTGTTNAFYNPGTISAATPLPVSQWITFSGGANTIYFDLDQILPGFGNAGACANNNVGNECTPTNSPFTLIQGLNGVTIDFAVVGDAYSGSKATGFSQGTLGLYTTQSVVAGGTITSILNQIATNGSFTSSYSASFVAGIPEPASILLMGVGLLGAGLVARKKIRS